MCVCCSGHRSDSAAHPWASEDDREDSVTARQGQLNAQWPAGQQTPLVPVHWLISIAPPPNSSLLLLARSAHTDWQLSVSVVLACGLRGACARTTVSVLAYSVLSWRRVIVSHYSVSWLPCIACDHECQLTGHNHWCSVPVVLLLLSPCTWTLQRLEHMRLHLWVHLNNSFSLLNEVILNVWFITIAFFL